MVTKPYTRATRSKAQCVRGVKSRCRQPLLGNVNAAVITQWISGAASGARWAATAAVIPSASHQAAKPGRL